MRLRNGEKRSAMAIQHKLDKDVCYQTQLPVFTALKPVLEREALIGKGKLTFIQEASNLGKRQTCVPEPNPKILLGHENFSLKRPEHSDGFQASTYANDKHLKVVRPSHIGCTSSYYL